MASMIGRVQPLLEEARTGAPSWAAAGQTTLRGLWPHAPFYLFWAMRQDT
jgi:hypothetical protein